MALNFPDTPSNGQVYLGENGIQYTYNLTNDSWTGKLQSSNVPIDPSPSDVSVTPAFGNPSGTNPGSGTLSDPFIITNSIVPTLGGSTESLQTITITNGKAGDQVIFTNNTTPTTIAPKYAQAVGVIDGNGKWTGKLTYNDSLGAETTANITYTGNLQVGNTTVYFRWVVQQQATPPMIVTVGSALTGQALIGTELGATQPTVTGGILPYTYSYRWQTSDNGADFTGILNATSNVYTLVVSDIGKYIRCAATVSDSSAIQVVSITSNTAIVNAMSIDVSLSTTTPKAGDTITATAVTAGGVAPVTTAYQWKADDVNIAGATSTTYTVIEADKDKRLSCLVTTTDTSGTSVSKSSDPTDPVFSGTAPEINTVTLAEVTPDSPDRYTDQAFTVAVDMTSNTPKSDFSLRGKVLGDLTTEVATSVITKSEEEAVAGNWVGYVVPANGWRDITYGNGKYVAIADGGTASNQVMYSSDGINWTLAASASVSSWASVTFGAGKFVALGATNIAMYSTDGINWTSGSGYVGSGTSVVYGLADDRFVATSGTSGLAYSYDGIAWNNVSDSSQSQWRGITYGNGTFVAITESGQYQAAYSTDGANWTFVDSAPTNNWYNVAYGDGRFVAVSNGDSTGGGASMYSTDNGATWTQVTTVNDTYAWYALAYGDGKFVAGAGNADVSNNSMWSVDGTTWNGNTSSAQFFNMTYGDGQFVSVTFSSVTNQVNISADGTGVAGKSGVLTLTDTTGLSSINQGDTVVQNSGGTPITTAITNVATSTTPDYASGVIATGGMNWTASGNADRLFSGVIAAGNGVVGNGVAPSNSNCIKVTFTPALSNVTSLRFYGGANSNFSHSFWINDDLATANTAFPDPVEWKPCYSGVPITISSLSFGTIMDGIEGININAIEVNGVVLIGNALVETLTLTDDTNLANFRVGDVVSSYTPTATISAASIYALYNDNQTEILSPTPAQADTIGQQNYYNNDINDVNKTGNKGFYIYDTNSITITYSGLTAGDSIGIIAGPASGGPSSLDLNFSVSGNVTQSGSVTFYSGTSLAGDKSTLPKQLTNLTTTGSSGSFTLVPALSSDNSNISQLYIQWIEGIISTTTITGVNEATPSVTVAGGSWSNGDTVTGPTFPAATGTVKTSGSREVSAAIQTSTITNVDNNTGEWTGALIDGGGTAAVNKQQRNGAFGNGKVVFVSTYGGIISSTDGISFTTERNPDSTASNTNDLYDVAYGNGRFVAVGQDGTVPPNPVAWVQIDGESTWNKYNLGSKSQGYPGCIAFGNGKFVAPCVGENGRKWATSTDGFTWTHYDDGTSTRTINAITFGGGYFCAGGTYDFLGFSTDGINWTSATSGTSYSSEQYQDATYGDGMWAITGGNLSNGNSVTYYTTNRTSWSQSSTNNLGGASIGYGDGTWVLVDNDGATIQTTDDISSFSLAPGQPPQGDYKGIIYSFGRWILGTRSNATNQASMWQSVFAGNPGTILTLTDTTDLARFTPGDVVQLQFPSSGDIGVIAKTTGSYNLTSFINQWNTNPDGDNLSFIDTTVAGEYVEFTVQSSGTLYLSGARTSGIDVNITATGDFTGSPVSWTWDSTVTTKEFIFPSAGSVRLTVDNNSNGMYFYTSFSNFNQLEFTLGAMSPISVTSTNLATPSITTDGGSWSGTDGTSSGDVADRETKVTGPVETTEVVGPYLTLSSSSGRWLVTESDYNSALKLNRFAKSSSRQSVASLFTVMDNSGNISDLSVEDPGYTTMIGDPTYTTTFPSVFPSGQTPDVELPPGTKYQVEVVATNTLGSDNAFSNEVMPVAGLLQSSVITASESTTVAKASVYITSGSVYITAAEVIANGTPLVSGQDVPAGSIIYILPNALSVVGDNPLKSLSSTLITGIYDIWSYSGGWTPAVGTYNTADVELCKWVDQMSPTSSYQLPKLADVVCFGSSGGGSQPSGINQILPKLTYEGAAGTTLTTADNTNYNLFSAGDAVVESSGGTPITSAIANVVVKDGTWIAATSPSSATGWRAVATDGNGNWVGGKDTNPSPYIFKSTDNGVTWTEETIPGRVTGIAYGNGRFVAFINASQGDIMAYYQLDGQTTWTASTLPRVAGVPEGVAFGQGKFVAMATGSDTSQSKALSSTDGIQWTTNNISSFTSNPYSIAYGNGVWIVGGRDGAAYSTNGQTWNSLGGFTGNWYGAAYGDGYWVFAGYTGTDTGAVKYSTTGTSFSTASGVTVDYASEIAFGDGIWLLTSFVDTTAGQSSKNPSNWTGSVSSGMPLGKYGAIGASLGRFVAGADSAISGTEVFYSDGAGYSTTDLTFTNDTNLANFRVGDQLNGGSGFNPVIYTGNSGTQDISCGFAPDLVWVKQRTGSEWHYLFDTIRGVTNALYSNDTRGEGTAAVSLTAFDTDGFTLGSDSAVNGSGNYVAWCWDAGNTTVTNNDGSVASQVRSNGNFSIVSFASSNASDVTVGHGLNSAPKFYTCKSLTSGNWYTYVPVADPASGWMGLNTSAVLNTATPWGAAATDTVFSFPTDFSWAEGDPVIAYCWAETPGISSFGSYTGDGSTTGSVINCGFEPAFVMIKSSTIADTWWTIFDTARDPANPNNVQLYPNDSQEETVYDPRQIDITSTGFTIKGADSFINTSGATYIYAAFSGSSTVTSINEAANQMTFDGGSFTTGESVTGPTFPAATGTISAVDSTNSKLTFSETTGRWLVTQSDYDAAKKLDTKVAIPLVLDASNSAHVALFNALNTSLTAYPTDKQTFVDALRTKVSGLSLTTPELQVLCTVSHTLIKRFVVTVAAYSGSNYFYIDGVRQATLALKKGTTYIFDQDEATNAGHPLKIYTDANKTTEYTSGVTIVGTPGSALSRTAFLVPTNAPATLYYQCSNHAGMGGQLNIS
jgi:hypothetical protein